MTDIKLKERCPFCGNVGEIVAIGGYTPQCQTYNCLLDKVEAWYDTPGEAAEAWDRRASLWRTDPPPKNGTEILAKTSFGVRIVKWENLYVFPGSCTFASGWLIVGGNFLYTAEIQEWKEIPK